MTNYSNKLKTKVVQDYCNNISIATISKSRNIPVSTIYSWIKQYTLLNSQSEHGITRNDYVKLQAHCAKLENMMKIIHSSQIYTNISLELKMHEMDELIKIHSIHTLCDAFDVSRSSYHYHIKHIKKYKQSQKRRDTLKPLIQSIFDEYHQAIGAEKISALLRQRGHIASAKFIKTLMNELNLVCVSPNSKKSYKYFLQKENIVNKAFNPEHPNQIWVSDITTFMIKDERLYLCAILDLYSRKIISYKISLNMSTQLVTSTFKAVCKEKPFDKSIIFHSDRGTQYTSATFRKLLQDYNFIQSFSKPHNPYDNSVMESFFGILKKEEMYRRNYQSISDFKSSIKKYINFYNEQRPHKANNYLSPNKKEELYYKKLQESGVENAS